MSQTLDLVVFDLDGTLVDSLPDIAQALNHALVQNGRDALALPVVRSLVGDGIVALAARALEQQSAASQITAEQLAQGIWDHYSLHPCVETQPYPEIMTVLETLKTKGVPMAVVTNKPGNIARPLLGALNMLEFFVAVVGDGDGFPRKPDPATLMHLMRTHRAGAERTLMVGDGVADVQAAKAAGCVAVAALWGYCARAALLVEQPNNALLSPSQILELP